MIILTDQQEAEIIALARDGLIERLLTERRDALQLLTPVQVCGVLNINQKTLDGLKNGPPRVTLVAGSSIRYLACDVATYIQSRRDA